MILVILAVSILITGVRGAEMTERKEATVHTGEVNDSFLEKLDFSNDEDFEDASRGFIAKLEDPVIRDARGRTVWNLNQYAFLENETSPDTVNPSLWRQARLNFIHGLFKVTEHIYQARGLPSSRSIK